MPDNYDLGRRYTLENKKYNRYFAEDFYVLNKDYIWKKVTDDYECSIKYSSDFIISVYAKYLDKLLYLGETPLMLSAKIDISDLISSKNLTETQRIQFQDDEAAYIVHVSNEIAAMMLLQKSTAQHSVLADMIFLIQH